MRDAILTVEELGHHEELPAVVDELSQSCADEVDYVWVLQPAQQGDLREDVRQLLVLRAHEHSLGADPGAVELGTVHRA